ncbi:MAG: glycosyltransferase, exosortase A system-associated [Aliivibrio sp.]|uniref:TIGR04063 family PEP-CTERM/XrtA system glycosyltransferase n=1 Tax=Aliivibrio sp. TaxID=1872443 RepID=UPI001A3F80AD|nr:glycosyltransferase, exosortase A system-associated [Aliivibrio sp.]
MKILHVLDHSIPLHSGYTFRTRSILKQQHKFGIETVHVTSPKHGHFQQNIEVIDGLSFYRSSLAPSFRDKIPGLNQLSYIKPTYQRIMEAIAEHQPDIIHAHSPALNGLAALKASKKSGIPFVYEIRAFWEDAAVDHGSCTENSLRYKLTKKMENHVVKHADAIFTICDGLRQDLISRGFSSDKITIIPNAVNIEQFHIIENKDDALLQQLNLVGKDVLGFLGSFYAYEGLDLLIDALPIIINNNPNIRLLLVGGGPEEQRLKEQVKSLHLHEYVVFTGRVPHEEVQKYYSLVDLLIYPRKPMRLTELVTPLKPLEAMAQHKLLLASDVGGHKELITDSQTGYLFKAGNKKALSDKVIQLFSQKEQWPQILINGRRFVENSRNWENSVNNYRSVYLSLTTNK